MRLSLTHYGPLREHRGCAQEMLDVPVSTPRELYQCLGFPLAEASVAVAVGDALTAWDHRLCDGDAVAFLPPVSGG